MGDYMIRMTSNDGNLRAVAAITTDLCETARQRHGTDPTATIALARIATGTALLGALLKGDQRLAMIIEGNGPIQKMHAETDAAGKIRCSIKQPLAGLPPRDNRFDVSGAIGRAGFLSVIKDLGLKEPYRGMVQLQTSEIGEDIAYYLTTSEQIPSSVSLGVTLSSEAAVQAAGGLLVQALPGCDDKTLNLVEQKLMTMPSLSGQLLDGIRPENILSNIFATIPFKTHEQIPLIFHCNCNRKQVTGILLSLGQEELSTVANGEEPIAVTCEYCRKTYEFSPEEVSGLLS
jgi:molecular chaperone Hsp33